MSPKKKKDKEVREGDDGFFEDIFDAYKQSVIFLLMSIVYNIIPGGLAFLGYYLANKDDPTYLPDLVADLVANPLSITEVTIHYGLYLIAIAAVLAIIALAAAFLFTASRNDRIAKPLSFVKAYLGTWQILFQFAIIIVVFAGIYFGVTFAGIPTLNLVVGIICGVVAAITPLAMILRVNDFLLELE